MNWDTLPNIDNVEPMGDQDLAVMNEVRDVLAKHGALERFGLTLLHTHFDIGEDEILVEKVDAEARTLTISPMPAREAAAAGDPFETSWRLDAPDGQPRCVLYCFRAPEGDFHMR
jgi:hypothetical protein